MVAMALGGRDLYFNEHMKLNARRSREAGSIQDARAAAYLM
jgi:hypothetical protein